MTNPRSARPAPNSAVSLAANPKLSSWVRFSADGRVMISPGKVEIGQGIVTALAQIAADELDVDIGRTDDPGIDRRQPQRGRHIRQSFRASFGARHTACLRRNPPNFSRSRIGSLGVGIEALELKDGTISGPGNAQTSYWELGCDMSLDRDATPGIRPNRPRNEPWLAIPSRVWTFPTRFSRDRASFTNSPLPKMLHGRVMRPDLSGAKLALARIAPAPFRAWSRSYATEISRAW